MPQMINLLLDQGPGENGKTEKQAPLSRRKRTFCFSTVMATSGASTLMLRSGAWTGGPGTHKSIEGGTPPSTWRWGHLDLQWLPFSEGKVTVGAGTVSWVVPFLGYHRGSAPPIHNGSKLRM
jgi:hypothetical protein